MMASSLKVVQKMCRLLSRVSKDMQTVVAREMPSQFSESVTECEQPYCAEVQDQSEENYEEEEDDEEYFSVTNTSEVDLDDNILDQMEFIVNCRQQVFEMLHQISDDDPRALKKAALLKKVEDVETRAVVFLTLPPQAVCSGNVSDSTVDETQILFSRFVYETKGCFSQAQSLLFDEEEGDSFEDTSTSNDTEPNVSVEKNYRVSQIPGFTQSEAIRLTKANDDKIFVLLSNPSVRNVTSQVKMVVLSACSQITRNDPEHCLDRLNYLLNFFAGQPVRRPGGDQTMLSLGELPDKLGLEYAWRSLLDSAMAQAERQFVYSIDSTLPFATVLATMLMRYPEQVPNFLARASLICPLLTLYTDWDLNLPEPEECDLQCWRGLARLFAAVLLARAPPGFSTRPPNLNPRLLWLVIAGIANQAFVPLVTAEVLLGLIEMGGFMLVNLYGRQAERLLRSIVHIVNGHQELRQSAPELALVTCIEVGLETGEFAGGYGVLLDRFWVN